MCGNHRLTARLGVASTAFVLSGLLAAATGAAPTTAQTAAPTPDERAGCEALQQIRNLTITHAGVTETGAGEPYCYVRGILPPAIHFHAQLPLPRNWNGRFLKWGDGGKDGDLDFADHRVAEGYAVANSNTGHDNGAEPGSSFAWNNRQAEIDFGYRAVHLTAMAGKTLVRAYYDAEPEYSYFEGCSTGGRQGLMEAQRYPGDFDGIVAGAPANHYQDMNAVRVWLLQRMFRDDFAGALGFDTDGDGRFDSVRKVEILADAVLSACDRNDGVADGVIDDPLGCDFDPDRDLAPHRCIDDIDGDECFTRAQMQTVRDFHAGPRDRHGEPIYAGKPLGSELQWPRLFIPYPVNNFAPGAVGLGGDHLNYLFYDEDPGVAPADMVDVSTPPDRNATPPEWAWWEFDINDVTDGKGDVMKAITDAVDPDLTRFLRQEDGKLILYHGWADALVVPQPTVTYYEEMVETTFGGDLAAAQERARLFMAPGMGHCRGGRGPDTWDRLAPLVAWVERGEAPDALIATHATDGVVDNERPLCPWPARAVYTGPAGGADDPANWTAASFTCRQPIRYIGRVPSPESSHREFPSAFQPLPKISPDMPRWGERFAREMPSLEPPFYGVNLVDVRREHYDAIFRNIELQVQGAAQLLGGRLHFYSVTDYGEIRRVIFIIYFETFPDSLAGLVPDQDNDVTGFPDIWSGSELWSEQRQAGRVDYSAAGT